ncbi:hypothetical protein HDV05_003368 [Chytridiales sp. JEL 0842]|nr:hypothetical protein HDV05_003368 [Chytridiales sp. JEL 0842]
MPPTNVLPASKRVVVTGLGLVTPLGVGVAHNWSRLIAGDSGIVSLVDHPDASSTISSDHTSAKKPITYADLPAKVAGLVPKGTAGKEGDFDVRKWVPKEDMTKTSAFMHYAYAAAQQALEDADWFPTSQRDLEQTGVCVGSGIGCIDEIGSAAIHMNNGQYRKVSPFFVPRTLVNMAAGNLSIRYNFQGPLHSASTACATGAHSISDALKMIQSGDAQVILAGATEGSVSPLALAGFCRSKSLSTAFNHDPTKASRPWDKQRDGFVLSEGSGMMVLESLEHARARGAKTIYAELLGAGLAGDAWHITTPHDLGRGAQRAMRRALEVAGVSKELVGYVNAHATSTPAGDIVEAYAIAQVLGERATNGTAKVSSTKGATGHLLGAAGAVEAIYTVLSLHHNVLPPTLNLEEPELREECKGMHFIPKLAMSLPKPTPLLVALSNSFGFGGTNTSLCFGRVDL